ncbi:winged helix-turn-helix domain-containing protein [Buttiauxella gaviniae]|uniref:Winged helix-turn-helix domain-containing protein n=1 Tax=Buttiauxella gaviniae TaxID=82990 RepID=A0ABV3NWK7_9ENTR
MCSGTENRYILDGIYIFNPSSLTILNNETNELVKIHNTSAKCLLLLIEKHATIVTQKQLLQYAWEEKSNTVTHNALYQCILNLRKNFMQLGCTKNIITTVPRKGLMIAEDISILIQDELDKKVTTPLSQPQKKKRLSMMLMFVCIVLTILSICLALVYKNKTTDFRELYTQVKLDEKSCKYFINRDNGFEKKEIEMLLQHNTLCKDNKFLFVTAYSEMKSKSVLICDNIPGESRKTKCISLYLP